MFRELCNPLTMKIMALGRPLYGVEELRSSLLPGPMTCQKSEERGSSSPPGFIAYRKAERIAAVITVWVILLCAMMGYTITIEGVPQQARDDEGLPLYGMVSQSSVVAGICGIFPVAAGTAGMGTRTLLHR